MSSFLIVVSMKGVKERFCSFLLYWRESASKSKVTLLSYGIRTFLIRCKLTIKQRNKFKKVGNYNCSLEHFSDGDSNSFKPQKKEINKN